MPRLHLDKLGAHLPNGAGGGLGLFISGQMHTAFNSAGTNLLLGGVLLVGFTLFSGISWLKVIDALGSAILQAIAWATPLARTFAARHILRGQPPASTEAVIELPKALNLIDAPTPLEAAPGRADVNRRTEISPGRRLETLPRRVREAMTEPLSLDDLKRGQKPVPDAAPRIKTTPRPVVRAREPASAPAAAPAPRAATERSPSPGPVGEACLPPLDLLDAPRPSGRGYSELQIEELSRQVEIKLADFGVEVQVVAVYPGPVVTLFELELAAGIKVSKITGLAKDLARALSTISVRVVEVIPGKSVIGIEIPNQQRETVFLRQTFGSAAYQDAKSPLTLGLGSNISGLPVVVDLAKMPHVLIAGTTGSGKSVAINAMILSLLYKSGPRDVRLIMVDPKMLELSVYEGIPHLLTPVVTDMKEAANALRWCVGEMERRYRLMAKLGVRNIGGYNRQIADAAAEGRTIPDPTIAADFAAEQGIEVPALGHLPYIVVVIDELADMMMVVGKKVEELIARLAQKARASGIHLLLATQRPSVDVLTGLIKANIPTRIAFQVSSRIDSRTVLDQMGAEQLLGNGDMLYLPPGGNIPQRVHGAFVDDHEVHRIVEYLKQFGSPEYLQDVLREPTESLPGIDPEPRGDTEDTDPLFDEAVQIVVESRRASISGVQRRLKIGYNRAARMIEEMERIGIVGPAETNGNREVLAPPPPED
jgi:DNA segregation ATPase FtsK/SpoIIIE, S-DNA-T family